MSQPIKTNFKDKYQAKGAQLISLQDYLAKQEKAKKAQFKLPPYIKYILAAPIIIVSCLGVFIIPYLVFQAVTSSSTNEGKVAQTQISAKNSSHTSR